MLKYGEVSMVKRLQAAHVLFTALEYSNDPIEILNEELKLLVRLRDRVLFYFVNFKFIIFLFKVRQ